MIKFKKALKKTKENNLDTINFDEVIFKHEIPAILNMLRENGYKTFTVSTPDDVVEMVIDNFIEAGCKLNGIDIITIDNNITHVFILELAQ